MASVVGLIPARGGSKLIPRKNLVHCAGKPLIAHTIAAASGAKSLSRVIVSTDDEEVAEVCRSYDAEVPFMRPTELAGAATPMIDVLCHALDWLEEGGERPRALVLLQPTSPLRRAHHIDEAVRLFFANDATSVVSVVDVPHQFNPLSVLSLEYGRLVPYLAGASLTTRRQEKPQVYARNGPAVLVCRPETLRTNELYGDRCMPYLMSARESIDVDGLLDLEIAECLMRKVT